MAPRILNLGYWMEVSGQFHALAGLSRGKGPPGTHWIGGWVGPRAGLNVVANKTYLF